MSMKQGKIWGYTERVFNNGTISIDLLEIKPGGFCSEHQHGQKTNIFHVIVGQLEISQWPGTSEGEAPDITILGPGESTAIPIGIWHKFRALEKTLCFEICEVRFAGADISRRTHGGLEK